MTPEILEIDCRKLARRKPLKDSIVKEMQRCSYIYVEAPGVPDTSRAGLVWEWQWRPWKWKEGPCLPPQARYPLEVEVRGEDADMDKLQDLVDSELHSRMRDLSEGMSLTVFLLFHEKYSQGLLLEEGGSAAYLRKSYVILGAR